VILATYGTFVATYIGPLKSDPCLPCLQLVSTTIFEQGEQKFHGIFALRSESSRKRKFHLWNFSLARAKVRGNESSSYHIISPVRTD